MEPYGDYIRNGLGAGWTSGLLSGLAPTAAVGPSASGAVRIDARPTISGTLPDSITIVYRREAGCPITVWEPAGPPPISGDGAILDWLFRRKGGAGE